ncbi:AAA family ATPase, partial [Vibrio campbellii]|uniref:AAA family ATPase n=1 Tax=Vibrio campbellii TaxID=680 RepID=UPI000B10AB9F
FNKYRSIVKDIKFSNSSSFDEFSIPVKSAITAICGRNGVGKSNLLKSIYSAISGDASKAPEHLVHSLDAVEVRMTIRGNKQKPNKNINLKYSSDERLPVGTFYFDPSVFSFETLEAI